MSRVTLATEAVEQSTIVVQVTFGDESGAEVAPASATWTLTNEYGVIVNERDSVVVAVPAATTSIVLTGDDLAMLGEMDTGKRLLLVEATYDSDFGFGLHLREEIEFLIRPLVGVRS